VNWKFTIATEQAAALVRELRLVLGARVCLH
jgi:hypothetical protein